MAGIWLALGGSTAMAQETVDLFRSPWHRVLFSSIEIEKNTSFLTTGSKLGVTNATKDVTFFIAASQGLSLSDADRARRFTWGVDRIEQQKRAMIGAERTIGQVFVSVGVGYAEARLKSNRPENIDALLNQLLIAYDLERRFLPALLASAPPAYWRSLRPPQMLDRKGGVVDLSLWWRPTPELYANLAVVGDTAAQSIWTRLRLGYRVAPLPFAIGPEIAAGGGRSSEKLKLGLHLGDVTLGGFGFSAAGGWMVDQTERWGTYGSFALHLKF